MANIYVFNLSANSITTLNINNVAAMYTPVGGTAAAVSSANPLVGWSTAEPYQPNGTPVPRYPYPPASSPGKAVFAQASPPNPPYGANDVYVVWGSSGQTFDFKVQMYGQNSPLNEDYLLYIATSQAILFDQFGTQIFTYPNTLGAAAAAAAMMEKESAAAALKKASSGPTSQGGKKSSKKSSKKKGRAK